MKKSILLVSLIFSFLLNNAFAEKVLLLTNPNSLETTVFRKGSYVVFELKADKSVREGFIKDIIDSSIVFDYSQVSLSQITVFAGSTKAKIVAGKVAGAVGNALLLAGTTVFNCGTDLILYNDYYYWPIGGTVWLTGAFIAGLGYVFDCASGGYPRHAVHVRNYRNWNASILDELQKYKDPVKQIAQKDSTQVTDVPVDSKKGKKGKMYADDVYGD